MTIKKPENVPQYKKWIEEKHDLKITKLSEKHYDTVMNDIKAGFQKSRFWNQLLANLKEYNDKYFMISNGYYLLMPGFKPEIDIKTFKSFLSKTFRKNVLQNQKWPSEPETGWILPNNWFEKINDSIRTIFIVKYLDGVEFLIKKIQNLCDLLSIKNKVFYEAREEGYYAIHIYINRRFEIPENVTLWDTRIVNIDIEIQITTQLQDVIRQLIHTKYKVEREKKQEKTDLKWQWDYKNQDFILNYLGHVLHLLEGMIMEIREKQKEVS